MPAGRRIPAETNTLKKVVRDYLPGDTGVRYLEKQYPPENEYSSGNEGLPGSEIAEKVVRDHVPRRTGARLFNEANTPPGRKPY